MEASKKKKTEINFEVDDFEQFGRMFGQKLLDSRSDVNSKKTNFGISTNSSRIL